MLVLDILVLLLVTNGAPVLATKALHRTAAAPVDNDRCLDDGRPLFGRSKTWRGLCAALLAGAACAPLLGLSVTFGLGFAALAMAGDLFSSFVKRRLGVPASDRYRGLDQIPESLLPVLYAVLETPLQWWWIILLPLLFMVLQILLSQLLYRLRIRKRPH